MTCRVVHIVDDDELTRTATPRLLEAAGFDARTYASAADFLGVIEPDMHGCIILDVRLPAQSGLDVQVALAKRTVPLPIIFVTGHGKVPDTVRTIQRGAVDFFTKPLDGDILFAAVARWLKMPPPVPRAAETGS
jgi:FixJ family two-component response regulator